MPFATELFAHFVYSMELTYDELLETERELTVFMEELLQDNGGAYIHFEALGDALRVQCTFAEYDEGVFQSVCEGLAPKMDKKVEARLLFVSKDLAGISLYAVSRKKWKEASLALPPAGPIGKSLIKAASRK